MRRHTHLCTTIIPLILLLLLCLALDVEAAPRRQLRQIVRDQYGNALASATCHFEYSTDKGSSWADATVYSTVTGTTPATASNITASSLGECLAYADDFDYNFTGVAFRVTVSKTGYTTNTYTNIVIGPPIGGTYSYTSNQSPTTALDIPYGVIISHGAYTLTFSQPIQAGSYQIFSGTGTVTYANQECVRPEWYGAKTGSQAAGQRTTNTTAINKALSDASYSNTPSDGSKTVLCLSGFYETDGSITTSRRYVGIKGTGPYTSGIINYGTDPALSLPYVATTPASNAGWHELRDLSIQGQTQTDIATFVAGTAGSAHGISIGGPYGEIRLSNVDIKYNDGDGINTSTGVWVIALNNCHIYANRGDGIDAVDATTSQGTGNGLSVQGSMFFYNKYYGIKWFANGLSVVGSLFEANLLGSILIDVNTDYGGPAYIVGNYFEETSTTAEACIIADIDSGKRLYGFKVSGNAFALNSAAGPGGAFVAAVRLKGSGTIHGFDMDDTNAFFYYYGGSALDGGDLLDSSARININQRWDDLGITAVNLGTATVIRTVETSITSASLNSQFITGKAVYDLVTGQGNTAIDYSDFPRYRGDVQIDVTSAVPYHIPYLATARRYWDTGLTVKGSKTFGTGSTTITINASGGDYGGQWIKENDMIEVVLDDGTYWQGIAASGSTQGTIQIASTVTGTPTGDATTNNVVYWSRWDRLAKYADIVTYLTPATNAGDPNGSVNCAYLGQELYDTTNLIYWKCTVVAAPSTWRASTTPGSTTDNAIARWDSTNGKLQNSSVTIDDAGALSAASLTLSTDLSVANGGTGASTLTGWLQGNGTSAITGTAITLGGLPYGSAAATMSELAGNTAATKKFLSQTGTGSASAAPSWETIAAGDIPDISATYLTKANPSYTGTLTSSGTTAGTLTTKVYEAVSAALSGATGSIAVNVASGEQIIGTACRVETAITSGDGGSSFSAAFATGSTVAISSGTVFAKDTKILSYSTDVTSGTATITLTCDGGKTFNAGVVRCVVWTRALAIANTP